MIPTLLCVDDDKMTLMLVRLILEKANFCKTLLTAENGAYALEHFSEQQNLPMEARVYPEVILLDLNMPVMSGWEFLSAFAETFPEKAPQTKIFILSSSVDPFEKDRALNHPLVVDFLPKPLNIDALEKLKKHSALLDFFITAA
ncbi:MAG: response regulator [Saprospiraceae bacterium]|nr:response regulator [Saprospiraceae bacterium]